MFNNKCDTLFNPIHTSNIPIKFGNNLKLTILDVFFDYKQYTFMPVYNKYQFDTDVMNQFWDDLNESVHMCLST